MRASLSVLGKFFMLSGGGGGGGKRNCVPFKTTIRIRKYINYNTFDINSTFKYVLNNPLLNKKGTKQYRCKFIEHINIIYYI